MKEKIRDNTVYFQPNIDLNAYDNCQMVSLDTDFSIYIHIPFCVKKCYFCSIETCQNYTVELIDSYVDSLIIEIERYKEILKKKNITCIHIGGGTPSILSSNQLNRILNVLNKYIPNLKEKEVILEANPMSIKMELVELISNYSKLSLNLGVQTFDDSILRGINRQTNIKQLILFLDDIVKLKLYTVGIDLICNLPLSNEKTTINDINLALEHGVNYFSLYPLRFEANSVLYNNYSKICDKLQSEEKQMKIFEEASCLLASKGFERYSIYHFNGTGHINHLYSRSQINGGEWIGFGAGANSYYLEQIYANTSNIKKYIDCQKKGTNCIEGFKKLDMTEKITREIVYALRKGKIRKSNCVTRYGKCIFNSFLPIFQMLNDKNYIQENGDEILLTTKGNFNLSIIEHIFLRWIKDGRK